MLCVPPRYLLEAAFEKKEGEKEAHIFVGSLPACFFFFVSLTTVLNFEKKKRVSIHQLK